MTRTSVFLTAALLAVALTAVVTGGRAAAGSSPGRYRVVFDVSVEGEPRWEGIVRNIENLRAALGAKNVEIEVVVYGKALPLLQKTNTAQEEKLRALAQGGVRFVACENSMKRMKVTRDALFPFVGTVDSGVAELVRKQQAGWSYLKPGG
jgi:intracellular sulfur oxidation DsrE/DsrF family protein